jgi:hypothetical protein
MKENRQRWFGHMVKREETKAVRVIMKMNVEEKRERRIPSIFGVICVIHSGQDERK